MASGQINGNYRVAGDASTRDTTVLHPAWRAFLRYCAEMQHGEIERLRIQDGVPVLAEVTTRKVKFTA